MGDYVEVMRELQEAQKSHRERMRIVNTDKITRHPAVATIRTNNDGIHLMVTGTNGKRIDVWPSTGRWKIPHERKSRTDIDKALEWLTK